MEWCSTTLRTRIDTTTFIQVPTSVNPYISSINITGILYRIPTITTSNKLFFVIEEGFGWGLPHTPDPMVILGYGWQSGNWQCLLFV